MVSPVSPPQTSHGTSQKVQDWVSARQPRLLINTEWVPARFGQSFEIRNLATEHVLAPVAAGEEADIDRAVTAARHAFEFRDWSRSGPQTRAACCTDWPSSWSPILMVYPSWSPSTRDAEDTRRGKREEGG